METKAKAIITICAAHENRSYEVSEYETMNQNDHIVRINAKAQDGKTLILFGRDIVIKEIDWANDNTGDNK